MPDFRCIVFTSFSVNGTENCCYTRAFSGGLSLNYTFTLETVGCMRHLTKFIRCGMAYQEKCPSNTYKHNKHSETQRWETKTLSKRREKVKLHRTRGGLQLHGLHSQSFAFGLCLGLLHAWWLQHRHQSYITVALSCKFLLHSWHFRGLSSFISTTICTACHASSLKKRCVRLMSAHSSRIPSGFLLPCAAFSSLVNPLFPMLVWPVESIFLQFNSFQEF